MKYKVTAKDDIERIQRFICEMAELYGKGLERCDCIDEGWLGFMKALENYDRYRLKYELDEFVFLCVAKQMQQARKQNNTVFRFEKNGLEDILSYEQMPFDIQQLVESREWFDILSKFEKQVAKDYIDGFKSCEIMRRRHLSQKKLERICDSLCEKMNIC